MTKSLMQKNPQAHAMASRMGQVPYKELEHRMALLEYERRTKRDELAEIDREIYEMARRMVRVECPPIMA